MPTMLTSRVSKSFADSAGVVQLVQLANIRSTKEYSQSIRHCLWLVLIEIGGGALNMTGL